MVVFKYMLNYILCILSKLIMKSGNWWRCEGSLIKAKQGRRNVTKNQGHQSIKEKIVVKRLEDKIGDANGCEDGKDDLQVEILGDN